MNLKILMLFLILSSCSSYKRTMIYSSLSGCATGGLSGRALSPNKESKNANLLFGCAIGGAITAGVSHLLYEDNPLNKTLPPMKLDKTDEINQSTIDLGKIQLNLNPKAVSKHPIPIENLPDDMKRFVDTPYVIKHYQPPTTIKEKNKIIYLPKGVTYFEYQGIE